MSLSRRRDALVRRLRRRGTREREGLFLVEGIRAAADALHHGGDVRFAVCSPRVRSLEGGKEVLALLDAAGVDTSWVDDDALADLSDTESPQGVLLACREPSLALADLVEDADRGVLVLDGLQDPGNVGTLVRGAAAFGLAGVLALDGTVDPWNAKAVRAAAGTMFRTRVVAVPWKEAGPHLERAGVARLVADTSGHDVAALPVPGRWALVVGNEGRGVRPAVARAATATVSVPMAGGAESLNVGVAGAILLYALTRSRPGGGPGFPTPSTPGPAGGPPPTPAPGDHTDD